ncbi:MAG: carbohydrate kinase, partial [Acidovorax sp.]
DSFLAGLLAHLLQRSRAEGMAGVGFAAWLNGLSADACQAALLHALASASLCVMERGCVPPSWQAAQARAAQHPALVR